MPTTLRSARLNDKLAVEHEREESGPMFALACGLVLLLAAAAIFTLPMALNADTSDMTWLMAP